MDGQFAELVDGFGVNEVVGNEKGAVVLNF